MDRPLGVSLYFWERSPNRIDALEYYSGVKKKFDIISTALFLKKKKKHAMYFLKNCLVRGIHAYAMIRFCT